MSEKVGEPGVMTGTDASIDPSRPQVRADLSTFVLDDELVVFDHVTGESFVLNATGRFIWEYCTGTNTVEEIAAAVATEHAIPLAQALDDTRELLDSLEQSGLLGL